ELPRTPERTLLRSRLKAARTRSRTAMAEAFLDLEIASLRRDLRRIVRRGGDRVFSVLLRLRQVRDDEGGALPARLEGADVFDADALHRLRMGVRRLR